MTEIVVEESEVDLIEKIKKVREKNKEVIRVVKEIKKVEVKMFKEDEWQIDR